MASFYGCSVVTITAASASDGSMGCLFDQDQPWKCQVPAPFHSEKRVFSFFASTDPTDISPVATRAWVVQERIMSPPILYFGKHEVFWECDDSLSSETFPRGIPLVSKSEENPTQIPTSFDDWQAMLNYYTCCKLTVSSDKLVAISAIARQYQVGTSKEYVAGLWKQDFQKHLCWLSADRNPPSIKKTAQPYIAPS